MTAKCYGAFEAKNKLSELLDRVEAGDTITIQRRGKPIAQLVPLASSKPKMTPQEIIAGFAKIRRASKPGPSILEMLREGRKWCD